MNIRYTNIFTNLIQHKESEVVEFKKAENNFDFDDLSVLVSINETFCILRSRNICEYGKCNKVG